MKSYKCTVCDQIVEIEDGEELVCPICGASGEDLVPVE